MKLKDHSTTMVIAGRWNRYILNPVWVAANVYEIETIETEFSIDLDAPPRFRDGNVIMVPSVQNVIFVATSDTDQTLTQMEVMAKRLTSKLEHTPILGLGMNFGYLVEDQGEKNNIYPIFNLVDNEQLTENGYTIENQKISRKLSIENFEINYNIEINSEQNIEFNFNYHFPFKSGNEISDYLINDKVIEKRNHSIEFLNALYKLTIEDDE